MKLFEKDELTRARNHPRRSVEESRRLASAGWFPFPELTEEENDAIFRARLAGYGSCFPACPDAETQARNTLAGARQHLANEPVAPDEES